MKSHSPIAQVKPKATRMPALPAAWFLTATLALSALAKPVSAQEFGPFLGPDYAPSNEGRLDGPLLQARPSRTTPESNPLAGPPPASGPGPFDPDPSPGPLIESVGDGPEPIPAQAPLLVVPPGAMPTAPAPVVIDGLPWTEGGVKPNRTAQITGPVGLLGNHDTVIGRWYHETFLWPEPFEYIPLPKDLLWKIPLANQREPRFYGKFTNFRGSTIDTAIGAQFGLGRWAPQGHDHEGIQLDVFGAVFTRFNDRRLLTAADYRAGIPITWAKGPWSTKLSYEHTSTHIGDEYSAVTGRKQKALAIDEVVYGLSRYFGEHVRLYGQVGYAFLTSKHTNANDRVRFDLGLSYSNYADTGCWGRPYAAYDMDLRGYQDYTVNSTLQAGWQWVNSGRSVRIGFEYYDGRSPYGQFYKEHENWAAVAGYFDW